MKRFAFLALVLLPVSAFGEVFSWEAPTTRTDGTPIDPAKDIKSYKFYRGAGLVAGNIAKPNATTPPPTTFEWSVPVGTNTYFVTAIDAAGVESPASNKRTIVVTPSPTATPAVTPTSSAPLSAPANFDTVP